MVLSRTLKEESGFDRIFTEVAHDEPLGLRNRHGLRLFHLSMSNSAFSFAALEEFLESNLGKYIFSRAEIDGYTESGKADVIVHRAARLMRNALKGDISNMGDELGDMMLYGFLEEKLNAYKLFNKIELTDVNGQKGVRSHNVHLLEISGDDGYSVSYQMIFGQSRVDGDIGDAVDAAFEALKAVRDNEESAMRTVERTFMTRSFDKATENYLRGIILPSEQTAPLDSIRQTAPAKIEYKHCKNN